MWDDLPIELQEIIMEKSVQLCREEYIETNGKKHERQKRKQGRSLLSADMIKNIMSTTDPIELLCWAFPLEFIELQLLVDIPITMEIVDYDYTEFYDTFLSKCIEYLENPQHADEWICPSDDHWLTMFTKLNDFRRKYGHIDILGEVNGSPALFLWLEYQKDPETKLSREKRHSLRSLGVRLPPIHRHR
jgi:hypothetical protein